MRFESGIIAATAILAMAPSSMSGIRGGGADGAVRPEPAVLPPAVDASRLIVGEAFPDLVLPSLDGRPRAVRDFGGEKLILHIFASW